MCLRFEGRPVLCKFTGESFASALSDLCTTVLKGGTSVRGAFAYIINKYILFVYIYVGSEDYYRGGDGVSDKCVRV